MSMLKGGLKRFGEDVMNSMMAEYTQIDDKIVFEPLMASKLSRNEKERRCE